MKRGRPFEPGNKFGRGRPRGSKNKRTQMAQKLLDVNSPAMMALAITQSRHDPQTLRMLVRHIVSRQRDSPVKIGRLPVNTLEDLDRASEITIQRAVPARSA